MYFIGGCRFCTQGGKGDWTMCHQSGKLGGTMRVDPYRSHPDKGND